jgi:DNA polymerase I-like protein with 3'-5' exonuclease and polymerase domains
MSTIKGMNVLRSDARTVDPVLNNVVPTVDQVEIELGDKYGRITVPFYYITRDDEMPHLVEWMRRHKRLGFDTETGGEAPMDGLDALKGKVATIQIGNPTSPDPRVYVLDVRRLTPEALAPMLEIFGAYGTKKLGQNVRFEYKFLRTNFGVQCRDLEDTQLNEMVIRTGLFNKSTKGDDGEGRDRAAYKHTSMDALCTFYLGIKIDKDRQLRTSFYSTPPGQHSPAQRCYAGGDVVYPFYVAKEQQVELQARQLVNIAKIEYAIIPSLGETELQGMYIDQDAWRALWQESLTGMIEARRQLDALFLGVQGDLFDGKNANVRPIYVRGRKSPPLNWGSSEQVKWAIQQYCKAIGWNYEVVTTYARLLEIKESWGEEWRAKKLKHGEDVSVADTPDWVIPEDRYCLLLKAEKEQLIIRACRGQLPWAIVDPLSDYSKYAKRVGTYGLKFLAKNVRKDTNAYHIEIHQAITTTGRLSAAPNSMNWPSDKRYRKCHRARKGKKLCIADYSQVEPRITAFVSRDPVYCNTYLTGGDLYIESAKSTLGDIDFKSPEGKFQRQLSKTRVLSLAYNMGLMKYRDRLTLALVKEIREGKIEAPSIDFARKQYDEFFEVHAKIEEYQEHTVRCASPKIKDERGALIENPRRIWDAFIGAPVTWMESPDGRKRFFHPDANPYSEAPNVPPQSGSATMLKAAIGLIQIEIDKRGWKERAFLLNLVHDELVYEVDEEIAPEFAVMQKEMMEKAGNFYNGDIPIVAEWPKGTNGTLDWWAKELSEEDLEYDAEVDIEDAQEILEAALGKAA